MSDINIKIAPDGTVSIDMVGFKGDACESDMKKLAKQIGDIKESKKKREYYEENPETKITE